MFSTSARTFSTLARWLSTWAWALSRSAVAALSLGLEDVGLDPRDQLAPADRRVEVDEDFLDLAGHLAADLDGGDGRQGAGGRDGGHDGAAVHRRRPEAGRRRAVRRDDVPRRREGGQDPDAHQQESAPPPHTLHCRTRPVRPHHLGREPGRGVFAGPGGALRAADDPVEDRRARPGSR